MFSLFTLTKPICLWFHYEITLCRPQDTYQPRPKGNLVPKVPFFYIQTKFRLKNSVTTVYLLQCKTNFFIHICFQKRTLRQVKEHLSWETSKRSFLIRLHLSSTFVYTRLLTHLHSCALVYTPLHSSSDSSAILELILY